MNYRTGDKQLIKEINKGSIFQVVRDQGVISRADIAKILKLTSATISSNVGELIQDGYVKELGAGESAGGRRPVLLCVDDGGVCFIGVDIHKNGVEAAAVALNGKIIANAQRAFSADNERFEHDVLSCIRAVRGAIRHRSIKGIGIGMHGIVDTTKSISVFAPAMSLRSFDIKSFIEKEEQLPVFIDNDANAMAIGESWFGKAKQVRNYIFLNVGRGIGAGVVINGEIFRGSGYAAGEIGHIRIADNGIRCVCGKYGCLDTVATEYSAIRDVIDAIQNGTKSIIEELIEGSSKKLEFQHLIEAAKLKDPCVLDVLSTIGHNIGIAVSYAINLLNPDMVVIGGSMSLLGEYMINALADSAQAFSMKECSDGVRFVVSDLRDEVGVVGAAAMVMKSIFY